MPDTFTSIFATKGTDSEEIGKLLEVGLPLMAETGKVAWAKIEALTGIGYSRGWLILRRAYIEAYQPQLLIDTVALVKAAHAKAEAAGTLMDFAPDRMVVGPVVAELHDAKLCSWGEIMCRMGLTEGKVRSAYKAVAGKKDRGLRTGKGGRFVADEPRLYLDNMKAEGAWIDGDRKGIPHDPAQCLNYKPKDVPAKAKPVRKAPVKKATTKVA